MNSLLTVPETNKLIAEGRSLMIAGDEAVLDKLHKGSWIGGTIPYFMTADGGMTSKDFLQVTVLAETTSLSSIRFYDESTAAQIPADYAENGFSLIGHVRSLVEI